MIWRKSRRARNKKLPDLRELDLAQLPILQTQEIISLLGLESRLKSIEKLTGAGSEYYQLLYAPALKLYIESVQLAPASASHHHAGPGGLVVHTLDVIDIALRKRKSYNLPQHSTPETISQQEHVWTYAVFAGALLHDIGKMVCSTMIQLNTGATWTPHDSSLLESGATHYKVVFNHARYRLHTQLSNGFFHLLPPKGRGWLAQHPDILAQLTAWLAGDYYEWGVIGEIVRPADRESVAKNLKLGGDRERFAHAPTVPLVDKLTTALRQLLDEGQLKINRPDGSAGWCDGPYTYLVCGTVADAVRSHLYNAGATDVPVDNSRIFDTWQEHGFVISTPREGAIWHLTINNRLTLTVLKFETGRIFHPSRRPETFDGSLSVSVKKPGRQTPPPESAGTSSTQAQASESAGSSSTQAQASESAGSSSTHTQASESAGSSSTHTQASESAGSSSTHTQASESAGSSSTHTQASESAGTSSTSTRSHFSEEINRNTEENQKDVTHVNNIYMGNDDNNETKKTNSASNLHPDNHRSVTISLTLDDPEIGQHFLNWIKLGLKENRITVNRSDALLHIVKEGVLIVSPLAFKMFARQFGLVASDGDETKAATKVQKKLERMMTKTKMHRKTKRGMNIHTYLIQGEHKESKIRGWLLPINSIYGDAPHPSTNTVLSNISGFKEEKKVDNSAFLGMKKN